MPNSRITDAHASDFRKRRAGRAGPKLGGEVQINRPHVVLELVLMKEYFRLWHVAREYIDSYT